MNNDTPLERLQSLLPQVFVPPTTEGDLFVHVQIMDGMTVAMPLPCVEEVALTSSSEITPIPNMPDSVMGLFNAKGYVFWLVDLADLIGLESGLWRTQRYEMIMVRSPSDSTTPVPRVDAAAGVANGANGDMFLGLAIQHVRGSFRAMADAIKPADLNSPTLTRAPLLHSYVDYCVAYEEGTLPIISIDKIIAGLKRTTVVA